MRVARTHLALMVEAIFQITPYWFCLLFRKTSLNDNGIVSNRIVDQANSIRGCLLK